MLLKLYYIFNDLGSIDSLVIKYKLKPNKYV